MLLPDLDEIVLHLPSELILQVVAWDHIFVSEEGLGVLLLQFLSGGSVLGHRGWLVGWLGLLREECLRNVHCEERILDE